MHLLAVITIIPPDINSFKVVLPNSLAIRFLNDLFVLRFSYVGINRQRGLPEILPAIDILAALNPKFRVEEALLLGHKMGSLGFKTVADHDLEVMKTFVDTWNLVLEGEIMNVELSKKEIDEMIHYGRKLYFNGISKKTAGLFAGSCKIGA